MNKDLVFSYLTQLKGELYPFLSPVVNFSWDSLDPSFILQDPAYYSIWLGMALVTWLGLIIQRDILENNQHRGPTG